MVVVKLEVVKLEVVKSAKTLRGLLVKSRPRPTQYVA